MPKSIIFPKDKNWYYIIKNKNDGILIFKILQSQNFIYGSSDHNTDHFLKNYIADWDAFSHNKKDGNSFYSDISKRFLDSTDNYYQDYIEIK